MPDNDTRLLAVLIDADNVPAKHADAILREVTTFGEPGLRRIYGDWSSDHLKSWTDEAHRLGLVQHQQTANTKGKNASDIGLVIDAMDILHAGHFDGFVLVSSDSDFTRLASRIREQGLTVIGIGEAKAPTSLKNACNRFVTIENITKDTQAAGEGASPATLNQSAEKDATRLVVAAMEKIDQDGEWFSLGRIGQQIQTEKPDFDTRSYGMKKLSDLIAQLPGFEIKRSTGNQPLVRQRP